MDNRKGLYSLTKVRTQMTNQELKEALLALLEETKGNPTPDQMSELYIKAENDDFIEVSEEARAEYASKRNLFDQVKDSVDNVLQSDKAQEVKEKAKSLFQHVKAGTKDTVEKIKNNYSGIYTAEQVRKLSEHEQVEKINELIKAAIKLDRNHISFHNTEVSPELAEIFEAKGFTVEILKERTYIRWSQSLYSDCKWGLSPHTPFIFRIKKGVKL